MLIVISTKGDTQVKKYVAAALTAGLALTGATGTAVAQQDQIRFDGLVWFDRNSNGVRDGDEPVRADAPALKVTDAVTGREIARVDSDADGRYAVTLPAGPEYRLDSLNYGYYSATTEPVRFRTEGGTFDFGIRGGTLVGQAYADVNRNGVRDAGEITLKAGTFRGEELVQDTDGRFAVQDLSIGHHKFVAADNSAQGYAILSQWDREQWVLIQDTTQPRHYDIRYVDPNGAFSVDSFTWTPDKLSYVVGDVVTAKFILTNRGELAEQPWFRFGQWADKMLSESGHIRRSGDGYVVTEPLQPGQSVEVEIRAELAKPGFQAMNVFVQESKWGEDDTDDNRYIGPIIVNEA